MNQSETLVLHVDVFYHFFIPYRHPNSNFHIWDDLGLETFGSDFDIVRNYDENYVWTVLDVVSASSQCISSGFHYVNRCCYLITRKPHNGMFIDFVAPDNYRKLNSLSLERQIIKLERELKAYSLRIAD